MTSLDRLGQGTDGFSGKGCAQIRDLTLYVLTAEFPYASGESFLEDELRALSHQVASLVVVPLRWWKRPVRVVDIGAARVMRLPKPSIALLLQAMAEILRHPIRFSRVVQLLLLDTRNLVKNAAVLPFGLVLGKKVRRRDDGRVHIHAHWLTTNATVALVASIITGIPFSVSAHRGDIVARNLVQPKAERAQFLRFISRSGLAMYSRDPKSTAAQCAVIHLGTTVTSGPLCRLPEDLVIATPASFIPVKGHIVLLRALSRLQHQGIPFKLHLFGSGSLEEQLREAAVELGVGSKVIFEGQVLRETLLSRYRAGDFRAVVLPSLDLGGDLHEGIPVSLIEAMACGVPVVSTTTGGIPELIEDGISGLLVEPSDDGALAVALRKLTGSGAELQTMREAAATAVTESFDATMTARSLVNLLAPLKDREETQYAQR